MPRGRGPPRPAGVPRKALGTPVRQGGREAGYLFLIAALTLFATSGGIVAILWVVLACSVAFLITSASSSPSRTVVQPGFTSPHFRTFDISLLLV